MLAGPVQAHPDGRDRLDDIAHSVAAQQRRGGQRVCQTQVGDPAGESAAQSVDTPLGRLKARQQPIITKLKLFIKRTQIKLSKCGRKQEDEQE